MPLTSSELPSSVAEELGLIAAPGSWSPHQLDPVVKIGAGRAAQAILVRAVDSCGNERHCVEKVFRPGWLTRTVYRCAFQAPFAYQHSLDAVLACFYRRRVAAQLVELLLPDCRVARPYYVRWDRRHQSFVLGCEFIDGRGIRPAAVDSRAVRRAIRAFLGRPAAIVEGMEDETDQLVTTMGRFEALFRECGLTGSGWQVCASALVSTSNLLKTPAGYVLVDLESGIPALLVPAYLSAGRRLNSLPLFDDIDARRLRQFLETHWPKLSHKLGRAGFQQLTFDVERLIEHTARWKQTEIAWGRRGASFFSRSFQEAYSDRCVATWRRKERIDSHKENKLRARPSIWSQPLYWLGLVPFGVGGFLQRLCGNQGFRRDVRRAINQQAVRKQLIAGYCEQKATQWRDEGRIAPTSSFVRLTIRFLLNWLLSRLTPAGVQRWLVDDERRRTSLERVLLLIVSGRYQRAYGRHAIRRALREWADEGRLHPGEYVPLRQDSQSHELDEYARCFGMHLSLKLITPVLLPLKIGGVAAFAATGEIKFLLPMLVAPALRTAITLWRMLRNGWRGLKYGEALLVGMLPLFGILAYPVQMFASHRRLSTFLIRDCAARIARCLPIYGGRNTRTEMAAIKAANWPIELLELGLKVTTKIRRLIPRRKIARKLRQPPPVSPVTAWDQFVQRHIDLLAAAESIERAVPAQIDDAILSRQHVKPAA